MIARYLAVLISICSAQAWAEQTLEIKVSTFNQLQGWSIDDHNAALSVLYKRAPTSNLRIGKHCARSRNTQKTEKLFLSLFSNQCLSVMVLILYSRGIMNLN